MVWMLADIYATERLLVSVLLQLGVIIVAARVAGALFQRIGQPAVVGEIVAGLLLGPSFLGKLEMLAWGSPVVTAVVFSPETKEAMGLLKELGLIFLLFLVGLEIDFSHLKNRSSSAVAISVAGVAVPFGFGVLLALAIHGRVAEGINLLAFSLFMGTALAITAMPVLGRMMMEWKITRTRIGAVTITAAAFGDAAGWILLAAISAIASAKYSLASTGIMIGMVAGLVTLMIFVVRPVVIWGLQRGFRKFDATVHPVPERFSLQLLALTLVLIFLAAMATSYIGIFAIFGAFLLGAILSDQTRFRVAMHDQLSAFVTVFFLPIFFTYTGLRTHVDALDSAGLWGIAAVVSLTAIAGKFAGCTAAARATGFRWRESLVIANLMNTRGLMELIVINIGYDLGVIPKSVFTMLVFMAVLTTLMTGPIHAWLRKGTEVDLGRLGQAV